jgi:hypothetical protein
MPDLKPNTVFLIGNGVLRVPCSIVDGASNEERALPGLSWSEYMDNRSIGCRGGWTLLFCIGDHNLSSERT